MDDWTMPAILGSWTWPALVLVGAIGAGCGSADDGDGSGSCEGPMCDVPCRERGCDRGVCDEESGECRSAESCTVETEVADCVDGEKCADGECVPRDTFCERVTCERGVCRFDEGGCTDAEDCEGNDAKCLEGKFCNEMDRCRPDRCVQEEVDCGRGVCEPSSGECEHAAPCESSEECLAEHVCVEGTCRLEAAACGDADGDGGCGGDKTCEYDEETLEARCREPETCETSFDCNGDRQCSGRSCLEPAACREERFEPNDSPEEATDFHRVANSRSLSASLCPGDTDRYEVDTERLAGPAERGELHVELEVTRRERGLGGLEVRLVGPEGAELGTGSTGAGGAEGTVELTTSVGVPDHGIYAIEVTGGGEVASPGVDYELSVGFPSEETLQVCSEPDILEVGSAVLGTTRDATSRSLGSTCTTPTNSSRDKIYAFDLETASRVEAEVTPTGDRADLTVSLRGDCTQLGSERACVDESGAGEAEQLVATLPAGRHYLVVQAPEGDFTSGGEFELVLEADERPCAPGTAYCDGEGGSEFCARDASEFRTVNCSEGCDPSTGRCWPPAGDACDHAPVVTPEEAGTKSVDFRQQTDTYEMDDEGCLEDGETRTGGPDRSYEIEVPPGQAIEAEVSFEERNRGALYLVESCGNLDGTCLAGAAASTDATNVERLIYSNFSGSVESHHLIVDSSAGQPLEEAELDLAYREVVCPPGAERCGGDGEIERCGEHGLAWNDHLACDLSCESGECLGDTCSSPVEIPTDGQQHSYTIPFRHLSDEYDVDGAECMPDHQDNSPGAEGVFAVSVSEGDVIEASWDANDPSLYVVGSCTDLKDSCRAGDQEEVSGVAEVEYQADRDGVYYIMADVDEYMSGSGTPYRDSTLAARVRTPTCTPHEELGCSSGDRLAYCDAQGFEQTIGCDGGCTGGACATPGGQVCADPIPVGDGESDTRRFRGRVGIPVEPGLAGACDFTSANTPESADHVYEIELNAGETLSVDWETGIERPGTAGGVMYLLGGCGDTSRCLKNGGPYPTDGETDALTYSAGSSAETVYLVVARTSSYLADQYDYRVDVTIE